MIKDCCVVARLDSLASRKQPTKTKGTVGLCTDAGSTLSSLSYKRLNDYIFNITVEGTSKRHNQPKQMLEIGCALDKNIKGFHPQVV